MLGVALPRSLVPKVTCIYVKALAQVWTPLLSESLWKSDEMLGLFKHALRWKQVRNKTGCMNIKTEPFVKLRFIFSQQSVVYRFMAGM